MKVMLCSMKVVSRCRCCVNVNALDICLTVLSIKSGIRGHRLQATFQQSKRFVPGSLVGIKDIDFVGRSEAETP